MQNFQIVTSWNTEGPRSILSVLSSLKCLRLPEERRCHCSPLNRPSPSAPPSLPPFPLPHISTFQHTDTVTARTDFHSEAHGQWAGLPATGRMPPLWFSHCCTMTNWDYRRGWALMRGHASGLPGHSCLQRIPRQSASYWCRTGIVRKSSLKSTHWDLAHCVCPLWHSMKVSSVNTMLMHPVFPADIWSLRESTTICEKMTRAKQHLWTINNRWECYPSMRTVTSNSVFSQ